MSRENTNSSEKSAVHTSLCMHERQEFPPTSFPLATDSEEVFLSGAISTPVAGGIAMLTASGQGPLRTVKGKGTYGWLIKPGIPGL